MDPRCPPYTQHATREPANLKKQSKTKTHFRYSKETDHAELFFKQPQDARKNSWDREGCDTMLVCAVIVGVCQVQLVCCERVCVEALLVSQFYHHRYET